MVISNMIYKMMTWIIIKWLVESVHVSVQSKQNYFGFDGTVIINELFEQEQRELSNLIQKTFVAWGYDNIQHFETLHRSG